jgi:DNA-directed RNA polymerase subunit F
MLQDDFIMRMIHEMVTTLLKLIFHIELGENEEENFKDQETASDYLELLALIQAGEINEAENKLLDELDSDDMEHFKMALMFYYHLNEIDFNFLEEHNYSKTEITDGLRYVSSIYGYDSMAEALLGRG